jgi:hypothetical protein
MAENNGNLERLLIEIKESLERDIQRLEDVVTTRFDTQAARMDRQGALIQAGMRSTARMIEWSEKIDSALDKKDSQISDLTKRMERLEGDQPAS